MIRHAGGFKPLQLSALLPELCLGPLLGRESPNKQTSHQHASNKCGNGVIHEPTPLIAAIEPESGYPYIYIYYIIISF